MSISLPAALSCFLHHVYAARMHSFVNNSLASLNLIFWTRAENNNDWLRVEWLLLPASMHESYLLNKNCKRMAEFIPENDGMASWILEQDRLAVRMRRTQMSISVNWWNSMTLIGTFQAGMYYLEQIHISVRLLECFVHVEITIFGAQNHTSSTKLTLTKINLLAQLLSCSTDWVVLSGWVVSASRYVTAWKFGL